MLFTGAGCLFATCLATSESPWVPGLLTSDLSVYQPSGGQTLHPGSDLPGCAEVALWVPQSHFLQGLWKCCPNTHWDSGSDTCSLSPLSGPTWDLGTWDGWKYSSLIQASALESGPQGVLSWTSCLTYHTLFPYSALYLFRECVTSWPFVFTHTLSFSLIKVQWVLEGRDYVAHLLQPKPACVGPSLTDKYSMFVEWLHRWTCRR